MIIARISDAGVENHIPFGPMISGSVNTAASGPIKPLTAAIASEADPWFSPVK